MFQKKKIIIPEPEPLTKNDIKKIKDKLTKDEKLENLNIKDLEIKDIIPQSFNGTIITIMDGLHLLWLGEKMDEPKYRTFLRKSKGGIFNKDVLAYRRGNPHGDYVLIEGNGERKIVRLIEDEEILSFKSVHLIHGIIKDKPYMLLRNLESKDKLIFVGRYIEKENSEHGSKVEEMIEAPQVKAEGKGHNSITSSVSLFDE
jgi:hypothetical protein